MTKELISIILPTYNRGYIIQKAIDSVLVQNYEYWELIIVDDGSTDETDEVVRRYHDERIRYVKNETNMGANYARNRGVRMAKGEFLAFIDSDNVLFPSKLEILYKEFKKSDKLGLVFAQVQIVDLNGTENIFPREEFRINDITEIMSYTNVIDTNAAIIKKQLFEKVGGFDESLKRMQDWDLFFRALKERDYSVRYIPKIVTINYLQNNSISYSEDYGQAYVSFLLKNYKTMSLTGREKALKSLILFAVEEVVSDEDIVRIVVSDQEIASSLIMNCLQEISRDKWEIEKNRRMHHILGYWKKNREIPKEYSVFEHYLDKIRNRKIALYGLGEWGTLVYQELIKVGVDIQYGIDLLRKDFFGIEVILPDIIPKEIECIIVSVAFGAKEIKFFLEKKYCGDIICIDDMVMQDYALMK